MLTQGDWLHMNKVQKQARTDDKYLENFGNTFLIAQAMTTRQ